ncbi:MAG: hypothetical protein HYT11_04320 [Candidatus Levybacteria bacterium]|nr:hypothetical protein [Candidatus Levybacteria bacterium]
MNERFINSFLTRRELLKRAAGLTLVAAFGGELTRRSTENEAINRIRRFEQELGDRPLTFEDAKAYVPVVADLFIKNVPTDLTVHEIAQSTVIVRETPGSLEEDQAGNHEIPFSTGQVLNSRTIEQILIDYPKLDMPYNVAQGILRGVYNNDATLAFVSRQLPEVYRMCSVVCGQYESASDTQVFLFLDRVNNAANFQMPGLEEQTPLLQFNDFDHQVDCSIQQPAVGLRTTLLHEFVHFDIDPVEKGAWINGDGILGFATISMFFSLHGNALEEFVADYIPARISAANNLAFRTGYEHEPHDFVNFEKILAQTGIKDEQLYRLHKSSNLLTFLNNLAENVQQPDFEGRKEFYRLGHEIFDMLIGKGTESFSPDWQRLKSYFPAVDTYEYQYFAPSSTYELSAGQKPGCIRQFT